MKRIWGFILFLIFFGLNGESLVFSHEIVYPKLKNRTVNIPTAFFIGSSTTPVKINGISIPLHKSGGFAYFVKLNNGTNTFKIKSADKEETYVIERKPKSSSGKATATTSYPIIKYFSVENDNTPLRTTPVNDGINRLSHLQKGVLLKVNGEYGNFYRVKLDNEKTAWIEKKSVAPTVQFTPAKVSGYDYKQTQKDFIITFHLDKKIPYSITEENGLTLRFYNTDIDHVFVFPYKQKTNSDKLWGYGGKYVDAQNPLEINAEGKTNFVLKIRKPPETHKRQPMKGITIAVDAGHGGKETGTTGCFGDKEKNVVIKMAKELETELKSRGANVIMTRNDDITVPLNERVKIANNNDAVYFVSIHNNALPETKNPNEYRGTSVYYYYGEAKDFAQTILDTMVQTLGTNNDGLHQRSFAVVRNTDALAILIEVAYLINPEDNVLLTDNNFRKKTAKAIADGIEAYTLKNATGK